MSWTSVGHGNDYKGNGAGPASVTIAGVQAGDVVIAYMDSGLLTQTVDNSGVDTFVPLTQYDTTNSSFRTRFFYTLSSIATGSVTYNGSVAGDASSKALFVWVFRPSGTAVFDVEGAGENVGTSSGTNSYATTGSDELNVAGMSNENGTATSSPAINGVAATASDFNSFGWGLWYTTSGAPYTGTATATSAGSERTMLTVATFKIAAASVLSALIGEPICGSSPLN